MPFRGAIPDFQIANPIYIGARVSFYTVNTDGTRTSTLATLFSNPTGAGTQGNPYTFDSEGKFASPVYIEGPVIAEVTGPNVGTHSTGVINARGVWRGDWTSGEIYYSTDLLRDPITGNIYTATNDYEAGASVTVDFDNEDLELVIDMASVVSGGASLAIKIPVRVVTTADITLSGLQTIDDVALAAGDRVLVKNQNNAAQNGIYNAAAGAWTRSVDADTTGKFADGCVVQVREGTVGHRRRFQLSITMPFVLGTSSIVWTSSEIPESEIQFTISAPPDGQLTTGIKGYSTPMPYPCTIDLMTLVANAAGSMVVDIYKAAFPSVPSSGSICGSSSKPTLTAAQAARDNALVGWTLSLDRDDVLAVDVLSVSAGMKFFTLTLGVNRN